MKSQQGITTKGRPRDAAAHRAALQATLELLERNGYVRLTLDAIATAAKVSRPTLYRWWDHKADIVLEALLAATETAATYGTSDDLVSDLKHHAREYADLLSGTLGNAYRAVFAEGLADPLFMAKVRGTVIEPRRAVTTAILKRAIDRREMAPADLDLVIDALYAPFFYRLLLGHRQIDHAFADGIIDYVMEGRILR